MAKKPKGSGKGGGKSSDTDDQNPAVDNFDPALASDREQGTEDGDDAELSGGVPLDDSRDSSLSSIHTGSDHGGVSERDESQGGFINNDGDVGEEEGGGNNPAVLEITGRDGSKRSSDRSKDEEGDGAGEGGNVPGTGQGPAGDVMEIPVGTVNTPPDGADFPPEGEGDGQTIQGDEEEAPEEEDEDEEEDEEDEEEEEETDSGESDVAPMSAQATTNNEESREAPTQIELSNFTVDEDTEGAIIGDIQVSDVDSTNHTFVVSDDRFEVVDGQLKLKDDQSLDFETEPTVDITITVTDEDGNTYIQTITIELNDLTETPASIDLDNNPITENEEGAVVGELDTTIDENADVTFEVSDDRFEVEVRDDGTPVLKLKDDVSVDFEEEESIEVTVTGTDENGDTFSEDFTIAVDDVDEAPSDITITQPDPDLTPDPGPGADPDPDPDTTPGGGADPDPDPVPDPDVDLNNLTIDENVEGAIIGTITTNDDHEDQLTYDLSDDRFEVVTDGDGVTQLKLKEGVSFDHETDGNLDLTITITDEAGNTYEETFSLTIGDVDEGTVLTTDGFSIDENAAGSAGNFTLHDPDEGPIQSAISQTEGISVVANEDNTYTLNVDDSFDFESLDNNEVSVDILVTDGQGNESTQTITLTVGDVNEAPTDIDLSNASVDENAAGAVVGDLTVTDVDNPDTVAYTVDDDRFEVVDGSLKLKEGTSLNHEEAESISVTVTATDSEGLQYEESFDIAVGDVNEAPTDIALDGTSVSENDAGATIGTLSTVDVDDGDTVGFSVDDTRFEVIEVEGVPTLKLKEGVSLNHEEAASIDVTVTATDSGGATYDEVFEISVGDVDEDTLLTTDGFSIDENSTGSAGNFTVSDADGIGSVETTTDGLSVVDNGGGNYSLVVDDDYDFEALGNNLISVDIVVTDGEGNETTQSVTLTVGDVNEAPTDIGLSNASVDENSAGATVGTLSVSDVDDGDTVSYTVSDDRFEVVEGELKLKEGESLNHEDADSINVTVTAEDAGGLQYEESFDITVGDVNEAPTGLALDSLSVAENADGAVVGQLSSSDVDDGDTVSYTVDDARFEVVDGELKLKAGETLDHETEDAIAVEVTATDAGGLTTVETFNLEVTDVNEAPTDIGLSNTSVDENATGATVGTLSTTDLDDGDTVSYTVSDDRFEVVEVDGVPTLKLKEFTSLDHEDAASINVTVSAEDAGGLQYDEAFDIAVNDVDEATVITHEGFGIDENTAGSAGDFTVTDPEGVDTVVSTTDGFTVVANEDGTYSINVDDAFDFEALDNSALSVSIQVTDDEGNVTTQALSLNVGDVNEAPTDIGLSNTSVDENAAGAVVGELSVTDVDDGDSVIYTVDDARFEVVDGELKLKAGTSLNHEDADVINVTVTAEDAGGLQYTEAFDIAVGDVNDPHSMGDDVEVTIDENVAGAAVGDVTIIDEDVGQDDYTYAVSDDRFDVVDGELVLKEGKSLNHEEVDSLTVTVTVSDEDGNVATQDFDITVGDVNEAPTDIGLTNSSVDENQEGAVVGELSVVDVDDGDTVVYTVDDPRFEVVDGELKLKENVSLDQEVTPSINVTVTATDSGGETYDEAFEISVGDVNETPVVTDPIGGTVTQNITASDGLYDVAGSNNLTIEVASFESDAGHNNSYGYYVADADGNPLGGGIVAANVKGADDQTLDIDLSDYPDGASVGFFIIPDGADQNPDLADGDEVTFSEVDGEWVASVGGVQLEGNGGDIYFSDQALNADDADHESTDGLTQNWEDLFGGGDNDFNDVSVTITVETSTEDALIVEEDQELTLNAEGHFDDPDMGDTLTYSMDGPEWMVINSETGEITGNPEKGDAGTYDVTVTVTDEGGLTASEGFAVVVDGNDTHTDIGLSNASVSENDAGAAVGDIIVTDEDGGDYIYAVSDDRFEVVDGELKLKDNVSLDFEEEESVAVTVTVSDEDGNVVTENFTITVDDVHEMDLELEDNTITKGEKGDTVGELSVFDQDDDSGFSFVVDDNRFEVISTDDGYELKLKENEKINNDDDLNVTVTVTDDDGHTYTETFAVEVEEKDHDDHGHGNEDEAMIDPSNPKLNKDFNVVEGDDEGDDNMTGTSGDDALFGHGGDDTLSGGDGDDLLLGGTGDDTIDGGSGGNTLYGEAGNDLFIIGNDHGATTEVFGGSGHDTIAIQGDDQHWTVTLEDGTELTPDEEGYLDLASDSSGKIIFEDGSIVTFEGIEKITGG